MKEKMYKLLTSKKLVANDYLIKVAINKNLSLNEFLVLLFFDNNFSDVFDIDLVSKTTGLNMNNTLEAFNSLMIKGFVTLQSVKDIEGRMNEVVKLDGIYECALEEAYAEVEEKTEENLFKTFETELGRTLSPMELEIINAWVVNGTPEELIVGALREAIYNGVRQFRYIDKIIYEWDKKGFKTMDDVNQYLKTCRDAKNKDKVISKKEQEISDFDWLDA